MKILSIFYLYLLDQGDQNLYRNKLNNVDVPIKQKNWRPQGSIWTGQNHLLRLCCFPWSAGGRKDKFFILSSAYDFILGSKHTHHQGFAPAIPLFAKICPFLSLCMYSTHLHFILLLKSDFKAFSLPLCDEISPTGSALLQVTVIPLYCAHNNRYSVLRYNVNIWFTHLLYPVLEVCLVHNKHFSSVAQLLLSKCEVLS